jgi:hypothetical protein
MIVLARTILSTGCGKDEGIPYVDTKFGDAVMIMQA